MWRDILISSGHTTWVLNFYTTLRQKYSYDTLWGDSPIAASCRQLIVQLCSLAGSVFPNGIWLYTYFKQSFFLFQIRLEKVPFSTLNSGISLISGLILQNHWLKQTTMKHNPNPKSWQCLMTDSIQVIPLLWVAPVYIVRFLGEYIEKSSSVIPYTMGTSTTC